MKYLVTLMAFFVSSLAAAADPQLPIRSGQYTFQHRFAEQPEMRLEPIVAKISGRHIVLINKAQFGVFPKGIIEAGILMWHAKSKQWIIGDSNSDRFADDVGGCSTGPAVVDLKKKIYWTC